VAIGVGLLSAIIPIAPRKKNGLLLLIVVAAVGYNEYIQQLGNKFDTSRTVTQPSLALDDSVIEITKLLVSKSFQTPRAALIPFWRERSRCTLASQEMVNQLTLNTGLGRYIIVVNRKSTTKVLPIT
jgi:hypothetical protein